MANDGARWGHRMSEGPDLESLRAVAAGLAHEIRNPLQFIQNYAEVVTELARELQHIVDDLQGDDPLRDAAAVGDAAVDDLRSLHRELDQAGAQIVQHAVRLDAIVESMLATADRGGGTRELTDLNVLVRESADYAYHGRAGRQPTGPERLELSLDPDLPLVVVDPLRLSRAVVNLVANALQAVSAPAAADAEPTVRVSTALAGDELVVTVVDNGVGMPDEVRARAFEPFFTATRGREHAGLGLTQVWEIVVRDHGGRVTLDSGEGHGTTATIAVPVER